MTQRNGLEEGYFFSFQPVSYIDERPFLCYNACILRRRGRFFVGEQAQKKNMSVGLLAHV